VSGPTRYSLLAETFQQLAGLRLRDEDGHEQSLELQPPATEAEVHTLEAGLPCPIPGDIRAAHRVSKGLANGPLESFSLVDLEGFGLEDMLPYAYSIAHDGFGNYWVLDLLPSTTSWGRFGPRTAIQRAGEERIWALTAPAKKPGFWASLFGGRRGAA
jgi:hypothetical protein